jgi:hypothetical protein
VEAVKRVNDIMGEITTASADQSAGIETVNVSITKMDEATQQNAALVEEAAAAAKSLQEQAESLSQAVSIFSLMEDGAAVRVPPARTAAPAVERRGPNRAKNVVRLPKNSGGQAAAKATPTAAGDEWQQF